MQASMSCPLDKGGEGIGGQVDHVGDPGLPLGRRVGLEHPAALGGAGWALPESMYTEKMMDRSR